jgi:predicted Zn-dependent protease
MRRVDLALLSPLLAIGAWIAIQAHDVHVNAAVRQSAAALDEPISAHARATPVTFASSLERRVLRARPAASDAATIGPEVKRSREPAPRRDIDEIHRRLMQNEAGTYINDIFLARDSNVARWPDRTSRPLRVWIQSASTLGDWNAAYVNQVRDAFSTWVAAGAPVPFTFVVDSSAADVHVTWVDHFEEQISGKTMWARDDNWWIVDANIAIALHHNHGEPLDASAVRAIALHEIGHLLGLDHCVDTTNIMTARVRVRDLSDADKATMRLIYALPPGSVKEKRD